MKISEAFQQFNNYKILVIGDVMIDSYMWGNIDRISPEAPIPIVSVNKKENRLGGAANVAENIKSLGAKAIICSVIGNDNNGTLFLELLNQEKLSSEGIIISNNRTTTLKTRIIATNQHILRVDEEKTENISKKHEQIFISKIKTIIENNSIDAIVFEDYDKGVITPKLIEEITTISNKNNIPILVDPKKKNFYRYKNIQLFKPNFNEFKSGLRIDTEKNNYTEIGSYANNFCKEQNIDNLMITLSENGSIICNKNSHKQFDALKINIADVSGAGDTVIAVASLCLSAKLSAEQTTIISNIAGGLVCEKVGVVQIDKNNLIKTLKNLNYE